MKFIDAIYKYNEVTRDNEEIFYIEDDILYRRLVGSECKVIVPICDLEEIFNQEDWHEYVETVCIPRLPRYSDYYYVATNLTVRETYDDYQLGDNQLFESRNYFRNKEDAQHLANVFKRLSLIINTKRYNTERDIQEIIDYIDNEYPILKRDIDNYNREYML